MPILPLFQLYRGVRDAIDVPVTILYSGWYGYGV
jgi:hypothetical protein